MLYKVDDINIRNPNFTPSPLKTKVDKNKKCSPKIIKKF